MNRAERPNRRWIVVSGLLAIAGAVAVATLSHAVRAADAAAEALGPQEPQLSLEGGVGWINTDRPIELRKLKGKVVILDFWTFCCINCHHVLPTLAKIEEKYKNEVVVIGVHTGKFEAERDTANIRRKVAEYRIKHPVVNDANQVIWDRFEVRSWPTIVVLDTSGNIVASQGGEVSFETLNNVVGKLVSRARAAGKLNELPVEFFAESMKVESGGLLYPGKITADAAGNRLFISDTGHNRIVITDLAGKFLDAIGSGKEGLADGSFAKAMLNRPQGTLLVGDKLYVADTENHAVRVVDLKAKTVGTVAGNGKQAAWGTRAGIGKHVSLSSPWDIAPLPGSKVLAVAMAGTHQIWRLNPVNDEATHWAGTGGEDIGDAPAAEARFAQPSGLATDGQHLYVADSEGSAVRSIDLRDREHLVRTIAGTHDFERGQSLFAYGDKDGRADEARLQHCLGVAYDHGKVYVADTYNNKIREVDVATHDVTTLAGGGKQPGLSDDPPLFNQPGGLSVAGRDLYVADTNNGAIRVISLDTKKVRTLDVSSVEAPKIRRPPAFKNPIVVTAPEVKVAPGDAFNLNLRLKIPAGYELNTEAPLITLIETPASPSALSDKNPEAGGQVAKPSQNFAVPIPLARPAKAGETLMLKVSAEARVCEHTTLLCTIQNFVWNIPIRFEAGAPKDASPVLPNK